MLGDPREATERMLRQTDRVIERAQEQLQEAVSAQRPGVLAQARAFIEQARQLQKKAWNAFYDRQYRKAQDLTRVARTQAMRALDLSRAEFKAHESLRSLVEQVRDLLARAQEAANAARIPEVQRLVRLGRDQLLRAEEAYRDRRFRQALRLAVVARDVLRRALDLARGRPGATSVETELERTDRLLERVAQTLAAGPSRGEDLLARAREFQDRARRSLAEGRPGVALRWTQQARQVALRLLLEVERASPEDVASMVDVLDELYRMARDEVAQSGDSSLQDLWDRGWGRLEAARKALEDGKPRVALAEARVAEALLRKVNDRLAESSSP
jgi:HEPN domain-containing protein